MLNPLYCYEGGKISFKAAFAKEDPVKIERAAIIINRGWIPAQYRDKKSRPHEINSRELQKFTGVWRKGKNVHDYKVPNNPDNNEWHNICLEDIGMFWELPNYDEAKYYYFQVVDLGEKGEVPTPPIKPDSKDEVIVDHYGWRWDEKRHQMLYRSFGSVSAVSFALMAASLL